MRRSKSIIVRCCICGGPVEIQPERLAELPHHRDLNIYCLGCGITLANAMQDQGMDPWSRLTMFHPEKEKAL